MALTDSAPTKAADSSMMERGILHTSTKGGSDSAAKPQAQESNAADQELTSLNGSRVKTIDKERSAAVETGPMTSNPKTSIEKKTIIFAPSTSASSSDREAEVVESAPNQLTRPRWLPRPSNTSDMKANVGLLRTAEAIFQACYPSHITARGFVPVSPSPFCYQVNASEAGRQVDSPTQCGVPSTSPCEPCIRQQRVCIVSPKYVRCCSCTRVNAPTSRCNAAGKKTRLRHDEDANGKVADDKIAMAKGPSNSGSVQSEIVTATSMGGDGAEQLEEFEVECIGGNGSMELEVLQAKSTEVAGGLKLEVLFKIKTPKTKTAVWDGEGSATQPAEGKKQDSADQSPEAIASEALMTLTWDTGRT